MERNTYSSPRRGAFRKPSFSRGHSFGGRGAVRGRGRGQGPAIHPSKFINKAVITEVATVFVPEHKFSDFLVDERLKKNIIE